MSGTKKVNRKTKNGILHETNLNNTISNFAKLSIVIVTKILLIPLFVLRFKLKREKMKN